MAHGRRLLDTLRGRWPPVYRTMGASSTAGSRHDQLFPGGAESEEEAA